MGGVLGTTGNLLLGSDNYCLPASYVSLWTLMCPILLAWLLSGTYRILLWGTGKTQKCATRTRSQREESVLACFRTFFGVVHEFPRLWRFLADTTFQERPYCTQNCALQTPGYACTKCRQRHENTYQVQVGGPRLDHQLFGRSSRQLAKLVSCDHTCCSRACRVSAVSRPQREKACTQSLLPPLRYEPPLHTAPSL